MKRKILIDSNFRVVQNIDISDDYGFLKDCNDNYEDISDFIPISDLYKKSQVIFLLHDLLDHVYYNDSFMTIINELLAVLVNANRSQGYLFDYSRQYRDFKDIHISEISNLFLNYLDWGNNSSITIDQIKKDIKTFEKKISKLKKVSIIGLRQDYKDYNSNLFKSIINDLKIDLDKQIEYYFNSNEIELQTLQDYKIEFLNFLYHLEYLSYLLNDYYYERSKYLDCRQVSEDLIYKIHNIFLENMDIFDNDNLQYIENMNIKIYSDYDFKITVKYNQYNYRLGREIKKRKVIKSY